MHRILAPVVLAILLTACVSKEDQDKSSTNIAALRDLLDLQFPYTSARWEVVAPPNIKAEYPALPIT